MGVRDPRRALRAAGLLALKALVLSTARLREPSLVERFDYYATLLRSRVPIEHRVVKRAPLLDAVPAGWLTVCLDERGREWTSLDVAEHLRTWERATPGLAFLVGDADGHHARDRDEATERWSLSRLTLPHQLCFVVIAEQLYRATAINRGEAYHRA